MDKKRKASPDRSLYKQRYKKEWELELKWLKPGKSEFSAVCVLCRSDFNVQKGGLKDLRRHESTQLHQRNQRASEQSTSLTKFINKQEDHKVLDAELMWANFVCENNLPVKLSDSFTKLVPQMFPDSETARKFHCARTKTSQIIVQALGASIEEHVQNVMRSSFFTLLIDESTDITVTRQIVVMARVFASDQVETHLYKVIPLNGKASGENLFDTVNASFKADSVPWENCLSMSSDGAKAMVGEFNSVLSRVKQQQENVWFLHCTCHVAHLAASHACSELPDVCEQLAKDVYVHFKSSGKRKNEFSQMQELMEVENHNILRPCFTRWLALLQCVERLLEQWPALVGYFDSLDGKEGMLDSVERIRSTLHSDAAKLYFLFLQAVLPRFNKFNVMFQKEKPIIHKLYPEICVLLRQFIASFVQFELLQKCDITAIDFKRENQLSAEGIFIGHNTRSFLESSDINLEKESFIDSVRRFYETGTRELYRLLPHSDQVLKNVVILDPANRSSGDWQKVVALVERFPNVIPNDERDRLQEEFYAYSLKEPMGISEREDIDAYWHAVSQIMENEEPVFPLLTKLAKAMLILPHSNAAVERIFSNLKMVKTSHRSRLEAPMLNALMHCHNRRKNLGEEFKPTDELRRKAKNLKK